MPGQTLSQVRALLHEHGLTPRHRLGQNFLIDLNLMRKLIAAAGVGAADVVLEVGPGTGSLTEILLATGAAVIAVEIDKRLAELLRERLAGQPNFTLIEADALAGKHQINAAVLAALASHEPAPGGGRKLVANLPYGIATPLLLDLLYVEPPMTLTACTVQKEVADRLDAPTGGPDYGPISVIVQTLAQIERIARLGREVFWPRPQVESAMILLRPRSAAEHGIADVPGFVETVRHAFEHRRQMLRRIVSRWPDAARAIAALRRAGINPSARPQDLPPAAWRCFHQQRAASAPP